MKQEYSFLSKYQGQEIEFVISEFNPRRNRVIGDRRQLLVAERAEKQKELFAKINVGDRMEGTVKNVTDFGAFIDLGGVDGLLHISEMSWGRVENPKKVFQVGDKVEVMIKDIHDTKIALSLKFPETNPWVNAAEDFAVGNVVTGKVARMTDFGAFVELWPGCEGLVHISELDTKRVAKVEDVVHVDDEIVVKLLKIDDKGRTNIEGVYAGGDVSESKSTVCRALGSARMAVDAIIEFFEKGDKNV